MQKNNIKKIIIVSLAGAIFGVLLFYVSRTGVLSLNTDDINEEYAVIIRGRSGDIFSESKEKQGNYNNIVPKGEYSVLVYSDTFSYHEYVTIDGFFSRTNATVKPHDLSGIDYVGVAPEGCGAHDGALFYSWSCGSRLLKTYVHEEATPSSPSVKRPLLLNYFETSFMSDDLILSVFDYEGRPYLLSQLEPLGDDIIDENEFAIYPFGVDGQLTDQTQGSILDFLDGSTSYMARSLDNEISLVNTTGSELYVMDSPSDDSPGRIDLSEFSITEDEPLYGFRKTSHGTTLSYGAADRSDTDNRLLHDFRFTNQLGNTEYTIQGETTIITIDNEQNLIKYNLDYIARQSIMCADDTLCTLKDTQLRIYDTVNNRLEFREEVFNVLQIVAMDADEVILSTQNGISRLNPTNKTQVIDFVLTNDYEFCGASYQSGYVIVCKKDRINDTESVFLINQAGQYDQIDRKITAINKIDGVSTVNTHSDYIYLSLEISRFDAIADSSERQDEVSSFANEIKRKVQELNIPDNYQVNIPFAR